MALKRGFSKDEDILDSETPFCVQLSAKYLRSFAYFTVNTRLPVILTKVIDHLARDKDQIVKEYGEASVGELKDVIGLFSKLKNELQTNKPFMPLTSSGSDVLIWNEYLVEQTRSEKGGPRWYSAVWLYAECYMYRRFREAFELSETLKMFDPFRRQKETALIDSMAAINALAEHLLEVLGRSSTLSVAEVKKELLRFIMVDLWGNSCDLSISLGEASLASNYLQRLDELRSNVLVDDSEKLWVPLLKNAGHVAIICDNAGYELLTDLCLADFLLTFSLADKVTFHLKSIPWFVSDVMPHDFHWTLNKLCSFSGCLPDLAARWQNYLDAGKWSVQADRFWTLPFDFGMMQAVDKELYAELARSNLAIVKGDLNYRKLLGENNWTPTTSFHEALGKFHPTNILALRTIKADLICGLEPGQAEKCFEKDPDWMTTGKYGVIQFDGTEISSCQC